MDYFGDGNRLSYTEGAATYTIDFVAGFEDNFDTVTVDSIDGAFDLTGGNGDGTATGSDAQAVINGQNYIADGSTFLFGDASGSYTLEFLTGFEGTFDAVTVSNQDGDFELGGGNGDGTASGTDARVEINGQDLVGDGNRISFTDALVSYEFELANGFLGNLDPVSISHTGGTFEVDGGNGDGTAKGVDARARVNGRTLVGKGHLYDVPPQSVRHFRRRTNLRLRPERRGRRRGRDGWRAGGVPVQQRRHRHAGAEYARDDAGGNRMRAGDRAPRWMRRTALPSKRGATAVAPPQDKPWGERVGYVRDINGFLIAFGSGVAEPG